MAIESPKMTSTGNAIKDIEIMRSYLFRMSEQLNVALNSIDTRVVEVQSNSKQNKSETDIADLKSLIIKTADYVETIDGYYQALESNFGSLTETLNMSIEETDTFMQQTFDYRSELETNLSNYGKIDKYVMETLGYIKSGLLYYENGLPVIGIAIGQDLQTITGIDQEGNACELLSRQKQYAVFTASELAFYDGEVKVAYVSKETFYMNNVEVNGYFKQRTWKQVTTENSWTLKWDG